MGALLPLQGITDTMFSFIRKALSWFELTFGFQSILKTAVALFMFLGCLNLCKAQDLIVTVSSDSLNCKITQIQKEYIFFFYELNGEIVRSSVPIDKVIYYEKDYYVMHGVLLERGEKGAVRKEKLRLGAYGGFSYMTGQIPANIDPFLQDHLKRLKKGFHIGGDFNISLNKFLGLGAKYSLLITQDEMNNILFIDQTGNYTILGKIAERLIVHYFAPNVFIKTGKKTGNVFFIFDGSIGCLVYRNNGTIVQNNFIMKGATIGMSIAPGVEVKVTSAFSINFSLGLTLGVLNRITMISDGMTETLNDAKENISRADLSI